MPASPPTPPRTTPTAIHIRSLTKSFPAHGGGVTNAVDAIDLTIPPGDLFFLLGPSGCGKTTLLRMIAGFIDPTSGSIEFEDAGGRRDITRVPPQKRNTGMVFQSYALWPHMTVAENVAFGLNVRKIEAAEKKSRVDEALRAVQMEQYAQRKPNQLSGGQQQRIALARALVIRPSVLLLDEPLSNLDAKLRNELRSEIRRVCKLAGATGVYVTHDQKEALSMADRVAVMRGGKIMQTGTPAEMYRRPANAFVAGFLGETNMVPGRVLSATDKQTQIETVAGPVTADAAPSAKIGAMVTICVRPESLRLSTSELRSDSINSLPARLIETTFLGETAQHSLELPGPTRIKVTELNPLARPPLPTDSPLRVQVAPPDVIVLPAESET